MAKALTKSIKDLMNWETMSEFSREMEKYAIPGKWRESHKGWVGNKRTQFPS